MYPLEGPHREEVARPQTVAGPAVGHMASAVGVDCAVALFICSASQQQYTYTLPRQPARIAMWHYGQYYKDNTSFVSSMFYKLFNPKNLGVLQVVQPKKPRCKPCANLLQTAGVTVPSTNSRTLV